MTRAAPVRARAALPALAALLLALGAAAPPALGQAAYVPPAGSWERRSPEQAGMDPARLQEAVRFAQEIEATAPRDLELAHYQTFGREPFGQAVGPFADRGPASGVIVRGGYVVAEWGEPDRVDMTFSVTKSFLSSTVGLAVDRGLIRSVDDLVGPYMGPTVEVRGMGVVQRPSPESLGEQAPLELFETEHNRTITWNHLLRQTSDWEGTLWGKPEWADRPDRDASTWLSRPRRAPGSGYEYNDVRVNLLALAALNVWRRPLPEVLREEVMDPIGASRSWRWYGYENSWVLVDGVAVQSVSGGGHWGGGMFINAWDQARFGLLTLRRGRWGDRQILSDRWIGMALTPTPAQPDYGFMNFMLNTGRERWPSAPESAFAHLGNGTNMVYVDPENDLVVVARWIQNSQQDALIQRVLASLTGATQAAAVR